MRKSTKFELEEVIGRDYIISLNPSTGEELGRMKPLSRREIDEAIQCACDSFKEWRSISMKTRAGFLRKLSDIILEQKSEIAHLIATEQGKPVTEALGAE
ncbi:MAG: aldehyde dehydrogenase family protein, partial [Calditrichaeota bacterium]|nr:aldehyde dehydrogenase family protein [Calditrichota bacterium]